MAPARHLPQKYNPLMVEKVPPYEVLIARRRLGHTNLTIKNGLIVNSHTTATKNKDILNYACLRAPIPSGIVSGIFNPSPPSYYLMRRSNDGHVCATGMFRATFPYATLMEEDLERKHIKALPGASLEEIAGNIWIPPQHALQLAEEYHIVPWINALLDNTPIDGDSGKDSATQKIISPPPFHSNTKTQSLVDQPCDRSPSPISPSKNPISQKVIGTLSLNSNAKVKADNTELSRELNIQVTEALESPKKTSNEIQDDIQSSTKANDTIIKNAPKVASHEPSVSNPKNLTDTEKEPIAITHDSPNFPSEDLPDIEDKFASDVNGLVSRIPPGLPEEEFEAVPTIHDLKTSTPEILSDVEDEPAGIAHDLETIPPENLATIQYNPDPATTEILDKPRKDVILKLMPEIDVKKKEESIESPSASLMSINEPSLQDTETLILTAKKMVDVADADERFETVFRNLKRKAREPELVELVDEGIHENTAARVKRQKVEATELLKERIKSRALLGITATLAIGAVIQYAFNTV